MRLDNELAGPEFERPEASSQGELSGHRRPRVLVIDDAEKFGQVLAKALRKLHGAEADYVEMGQMALEKIRAGKSYDLIFIDLQMPEMDGLKTYRLLERLVSSKLILMSAYPDGELWVAATELGLEPVHKPIKKETIRDVLASLELD